MSKYYPNPHPCPECGTVHAAPNAAYCSDECRAAAIARSNRAANHVYRRSHKRQPSTVRCRVCGRGVPLARGTSSYCSRECYYREFACYRVAEVGA